MTKPDRHCSYLGSLPRSGQSARTRTGLKKRPGSSLALLDCALCVCGYRCFHGFVSSGTCCGCRVASCGEPERLRMMNVRILILITAQLAGCLRAPRGLYHSDTKEYQPKPTVELSTFSEENRIVTAYIR